VQPVVQATDHLQAVVSTVLPFVFLLCKWKFEVGICDLKLSLCKETGIDTYFLDPEGGSQNATLVVLVLLVVVISSLKISKSFLIHSAAQRNFAHTFMLIFPTDLPSQIFKLICN